MATAQPPSGMLAHLAQEIRRRNVVPWTLGYIAGGWLILELTAFLAGEYAWPDGVTRVLPVILAFGVPSVITAAWYHGMSGWQRPRGKEIAIHAVLAALLLTTLGLWGGAAPRSDSSGPASLTRLAVLYFKNHAADPALGDVAGDLTESVVHRLANVPALEVLPLTAVEPYRGAATPSFRELVSELDVGALVEGSLTRTGDSIRVVAQLFEAETGTHLASWELTEADGGSGRWVPAVANMIADSIRVRVGREIEWRRAEGRSNVAQAVESYRRARSIIENEAAVTWREDRRAGLELLMEADALLEEAERLDPVWPDPVILQIDVDALAARLEGGAGNRDPRLMREAIAHATEALDLVRDSAETLERRGVLLYRLAAQVDRADAVRLYDEAEGDLRAAVRLDPGRAHAWWTLGQLYQMRGSFEAAYDFTVRAQETDSYLELGPDTPLGLLLTSLQRQRLGEARHWCDEGIRLYPLDQGMIQGCLALLVSLPDPTEGDVQEAWELTRTLGLDRVGMAERRPGWVALGQTATAAVLARRGQADSVEQVLRRANRTFQTHRPVLGQNLIAYGAMYEALAWLRLGQTDSAMARLGVFAELLPAEASRLSSEWWFRELWDDPRYQALHSPTPTESGTTR
jgi:TolB-like protein